MSTEVAFLTYATKRIADINSDVEMMEGKIFKTTEVQANGEEIDTTDQTLSAYKAERDALQSIKSELEAGHQV